MGPEADWPVRYHQLAKRTFGLGSRIVAFGPDRTFKVSAMPYHSITETAIHPGRSIPNDPRSAERARDLKAFEAIFTKFLEHLRDALAALEDAYG